jgi:hypothetical protein
LLCMAPKLLMDELEGEGWNRSVGDIGEAPKLPWRIIFPIIWGGGVADCWPGWGSC